MVSRANAGNLVGVSVRDYEFEYYGLLHILKDLSFDLKKIRDTVMDKETIDRYVNLIDHEVAKSSNGTRR